MFNPTEVMINTCIEHLKSCYRNIYSHRQAEYLDLISRVTSLALSYIANSDALYHNVEHTVLVTLVGQEILLGKYIREQSVSCEDWLHFIISLLCHDLGYAKGICKQDRVEERLYATGLEDITIAMPVGATDASLTLFHIDRAKLFIEECFGSHPLIDTQRLKRNIELTRFPVPEDEEHADTVNYPGLTRAADLIGQMSDPRYLQKVSALFYEFAEIGVNKSLGYTHPGDMRKNYPSFYANVVSKYIQPALGYLELTACGQQITANLYANVFRAQHE